MQRLLPLVVAALLGACSDPTPPSSSATLEALSDEPFEQPLDFLLARYDADGDGRIARAEYDRSEVGFRRLDRNGDGVLDAADFPAGDRGARKDRKELRDRAALELARYFQEDGDLRRVEARELHLAFARYDSDGDGRVDRDEFECAASTLEHDLPGAASVEDGSSPWRTLLQGVDADADGRLSRDELDAFFGTSDNQAWALFGDEVVAGPVELLDELVARPLQGLAAPDFELAGPDGHDVVRLSELRGRPVVLIFGSYT